MGALREAVGTVVRVWWATQPEPSAGTGAQAVCQSLLDSVERSKRDMASAYSLAERTIPKMDGPHWLSKEEETTS